VNQSIAAGGLFPELVRQPTSLAAGALPSQLIRDLILAGRLPASRPISSDQIQPSSLDLRLGSVAYRVRASFLPGPLSTVAKKLSEFTMAEIDIDRQAAVFEKDCVYIVPLMESVALNDDLSAKANPKSTTGRLDVFTRLITDYAGEFEWVRSGYSGPLFAEIAPRAFSILVRAGMRLNQIRFFKGDAFSSDPKVKRLDEEESLVWLNGQPVAASIDRGLTISVDIRGLSGGKVTAFRAKKNAPVIDLERVNYYEPSEFWEVVAREGDQRLILDANEFYILASRESVRVPPGHAAEMLPFDPTTGEYRIHYAGFFDPGFGYGATGEIKGTPAVLEVRAHQVPFVLEDGQVVGRLEYLPLLEFPDKLYGQKIGSSYHSQGLALSKQFKPWKARMI
jgi:dCTP deaminase